MATYICQYRNEGKEVKIEATTSEQAYKLFLQQTGSKPDLVYVSLGGLLSNNDVYSGHFDQNEHLKQLESERPPQTKGINTLPENAPDSDKILSLILENQIKQTELLNKIRWSLFWIVFFVATIWAFGFVIKVK